jgi:hypothetical protein
MADRSIFRITSPAETQLIHDGYCKLAVFPAEILQKLNIAIMNVMKAEPITFYNTGLDRNTERKKYFYKIVLDAFTTYIDSVFYDYKISRIAVVIKGIQGQSECNLHTDDNSFDEENAFPINIWTPLLQTHPENGGICVIPGSHNYASKTRGFGIPQYYNEYADELKQKGICISTTLGESLVYHPGLLHFSNENRTPEFRPAVVIALTPKEKTPLVFFGKRNWWSYKIYTMHLSLEEYIYWNEDTVLKNNIMNVRNFKSLKPDKTMYQKFLTLTNP